MLASFSPFSHRTHKVHSDKMGHNHATTSLAKA